MITCVKDYNLQDTFVRILRHLKDAPIVNVGYKNTGGGETKELHPCIIEISDPCMRTLLYPRRGNNPFTVLAESYWVMAGRNDVSFLEPFLPRAVDFSDDGKVWRAGYGPRLRNWTSIQEDKSMIVKDKDGNVKEYGLKRTKVDQLQFIIKQLVKNPASRQAIMSIWDPAIEGTVEATKDWPCSNWIHFMIRDSELDCNVVMRSNDIIWGWSQTNVYEFTVIQEVIARSLGIPVGKYYHMSDSMHIYDKSYEKMDELLQTHINYETEFNKLPKYKFGYSSGPRTVVPSVYLGNYLLDVELMCDKLMNFNIPFTESKFEDINTSLKLLEFFKGQAIFSLDNPWGGWTNLLKTIPFTDLKVACHYWYVKNILRQKDGGLDMIKKCIDECVV